MDIQAATRWESNADLIKACHELGYIKDEDLVLDPTYGEGVFWQKYRPKGLIWSDLDPDKTNPVSPPVDFTDMPYVPGTFDVVVFDPPYKLNGTPVLGAFDERYGIAQYTKWQDRMQLCIDGITECVRVLKKKGYLLVKCQDQVVSGKMRWSSVTWASRP